MIKTHPSSKELRTFGLIVGGVFGLVGLWPILFRHAPPRTWALTLALLLAIPAALYPSLLAHPHKWWMRLGHVLGWINTKLILSLFFYIILVPVGLVLRAIGRDPMQRRYDPEASSYRQQRQARPGSHMWHQF